MIITYGKYIPQKQKLYIEIYEVEIGPGSKYWCGINGDCCFEASKENCVQIQSSSYCPYFDVFTSVQENSESYVRILLSDYLKNLSTDLLIQEAEYKKLPEIEELYNKD